MWVLPGWESPGEGNGDPLRYCCLENPMHRERSLAGTMGHRGSQRVGPTEQLSISLFIYLGSFQQ